MKSYKAQRVVRTKKRHDEELVTFLPLTKAKWDDFEEFLDQVEDPPYDLGLAVISGSLGFRSDILNRAARTAQIFHKVCRALHAELPSDSDLQQKLFRPLSPIPFTGKSIRTAPFFMRYMRMDFFVDPKSGDLGIIEVNSGGASMTHYLLYSTFLKQHHDFSPPKGFRTLSIPDVLRTITEYCTQQKPEVRTMGFVARGNGNEDYLTEYQDYCHCLAKNTDIRGVLLELDDGRLSLLRRQGIDCPLQKFSDLDAILVDWFEDMECMDRTHKQLQKNDVLVVPPLSDILFENKGFLSTLQALKKPRGIQQSDWDLLQSALIPSFPLENLEEHLSEMKKWKGVVLKMDIDCAGESVFIYDFAKKPRENVVRILKRRLAASREEKTTWTVQQLREPHPFPQGSSAQKWDENDYQPCKLDLMTYLTQSKNGPHVLFGSRVFSRTKVDDVTTAGRDDTLFGPVSLLPY